MWEYSTTKDGILKFNPGKNSLREYRCPICGQYLKKNEFAYMIFPPHSVKKMTPKLKGNFMVHIEEWDSFCEGIEDDTALAVKIANHRQPRKKPFTETEQTAVSAFKTACIENGFTRVFEKPYGAKCQRVSSSITVEYNVYYDHIKLNCRGRTGLFDGIYAKKICAKIYNRMHEIIGDGLQDDYDDVAAMNKFRDDCQKIMSDIL